MPFVTIPQTSFGLSALHGHSVSRRSVGAAITTHSTSEIASARRLLGEIGLNGVWARIVTIKSQVIIPQPPGKEMEAPASKAAAAAAAKDKEVDTPPPQLDPTPT